ncbi:glycosyltransferase [Phytohabitans rumicis]|uniref:Glycosyl transferase n=1 Tax=Phytohabitans rumicis TaxID=1076125 RepID=A0A6V8LNT7_9ACTN|nr:glycosyltransferase [Phytohabitans rumicis]GFJ96538.1 hypothetical protein Prum_101800 [Phytohabitans rumicis]
MSTSGEDAPELSVIVPTYNRSALLRQTLENLARQRLPADRFEVIVSDDGSSDDTRAVVEDAASALRMRYHFQPDEGFRAGAARNAGARLARAPILVFLDTGALVGPDHLERHLAEHAGGARVAVVGYAHGYEVESVMPGLSEALLATRPEDVVATFRDQPQFADARHPQFAACDFDLTRLAAPWLLFWTLNCSLRADDFWAVGGFDEDYRGWGLEDLDLGYRMHRDGVGFRLTRSAWVVHAPHERDLDAIMAECMVNLGRLLSKHPEPAMELVWQLLRSGDLLDLEECYQVLLSWTERARTVDTAPELAETLRRLAPAGRVAVVGAGPARPETQPAAVLLDFDAAVLAAGHEAVGHHAIGIRTPLADQSVDAVIITSRLAGLWPRWGDDVLAEARRIGRAVHLTDPLARQTTSAPAHS